MLLLRTRWTFTTGVLLCVFNVVGCQATQTLQTRSLGPVPEAGLTSHQNLAYMAQLPSAYHILSTSNSDSVARGNVVQTGVVARAQKPELLPPPTAQDQVPQAPVVSTAPATVDASPVTVQDSGHATATVATGEEWLSGWERWKRKMQAKCVGYLEEFQAPPLGHAVYLHGRAQVENGEAARMVLYHYDFEEGGARLTLRGRDQLAKIQHMLGTNFFPLVIERTPDVPGLDEARRAMVLQVLAHGQFPVPPERVVIGPSPTPGLRGAEAEVIYRNQIGVTRSSGAPLPQTQDVSGTLLNVTPLTQGSTPP
jgi:hypothetical protein